MKLSKIAGFPASRRESTSEVQIMASRRGQAAGLPHRADAVPQDQPRVEHVADQPLGQGEQAGGGRRPVQDHQVNVAVGGHVAAAITAVGHDGDVVDEPLGTGLAQVLQGILDQFQDHGVAKVAVQRASSIPGQPAACRALKSSWPFASRALAASTLERSMGNEPKVE